MAGIDGRLGGQARGSARGAAACRLCLGAFPPLSRPRLDLCREAPMRGERGRNAFNPAARCPLSLSVMAQESVRGAALRMC